jgi:hypothetical protein
MNALTFLLTVLAAWRVASLLVNEDGPGAICARLRLRAGISYVVRQNGAGQPEAMRVAHGWLAEGLTCVWCVSVWTAALFVLLALIPYANAVSAVLRDVLAVSAGAILLHEALERLRP